MVQADQRLAGQLVEARRPRRSASRRLLGKISVDRWARMSSSSRGWIADQIDGRASPRPAGPLGIWSGFDGLAMSSTGTSMVSASDFFFPASTMVTGR